MVKKRCKITDRMLRLRYVCVTFLLQSGLVEKVVVKFTKSLPANANASANVPSIMLIFLL